MKDLSQWTMIDRNSPEWAAMWAALQERVEADYVCPDTGEVWQYMGTKRATPSHPWKHEFRHRRYVGRGRVISVPGRTVLEISASDSFHPELVRDVHGLVGGSIH